MFMFPGVSILLLFGGIVGFITKYDSKISFQLIHAGIITIILGMLLTFYYGEYEVWMM